MIEKLNAALHEELHDVEKYMLMSAQADDKFTPILRLIANEEMRHARHLIDMIHEMGGEVTDENHAEVHKAEKVVAK